MSETMTMDGHPRRSRRNSQLLREMIASDILFILAFFITKKLVMCPVLRDGNRRI
jgi:hypothetical protein